MHECAKMVPDNIISFDFHARVTKVHVCMSEFVCECVCYASIFQLYEKKIRIRVLFGIGTGLHNSNVYAHNENGFFVYVCCASSRCYMLHAFWTRTFLPE